MPKGIFVRTPEHLAKLAANGRANKGRKHTEEWKAALSRSLQGNAYRLGIPHTEETKRRLQETSRRGSIEDRFWSRVNKSETCWLWTGAVFPNGYGRLLIGSRMDGTRREALTHRLSYEWANGPIPDGLLVCHSCDTDYPVRDITYRRCVRPDHLFLGTTADNSIDMANKGRAKGHTKKHLTEHRGRSILTITTVRAIRRDYESGGLTFVELGRRYGVKDVTISKVIHRRTWADVE